MKLEFYISELIMYSLSILLFGVLVGAAVATKISGSRKDVARGGRGDVI